MSPSGKRVQISCLGNMGRFGNQLFQYAFARSFAEKHGAVLETPRDWIGRELFGLDDPPINQPLPRCQIEEIPDHADVDLHGYFQNQDALDVVDWPKVKKWFTFKTMIPQQGVYTACHLRRGDYLSPYFITRFCTVSKASYERALEKYRIHPSTVRWVGEDSGNTEIEDFQILMQAKYLFRANSSYSWWASFLGGMQTFSPLVEDKVGEQDVDFVPGNWPRLCDPTRVANKVSDLCAGDEKLWSKMAFLLRLRVDTSGRLDNLKACMERLAMFPGGEVIIVEMDATPKADVVLKNYPCQYLFEKDDGGYFHMTRAVNVAARHTTRPILCIQDIDTLVTQEQYRNSVTALLSGQVDYSFPYDGEFILLDDAFSWNVRKDIALTDRLVPTNGRSNGTGSFGGTILLKRDVFYAIGQENENLLSWGFDDWEREVRLRVLGYTMHRSDGPIYHLWHPDSSNSRNHTEPTRHRNEAECNRVKFRKRDQLLEYINSWPWVSGNAKLNEKEACRPMPTSQPDEDETYLCRASYGDFILALHKDGKCEFRRKGSDQACNQGTWEARDQLRRMTWNTGTIELFDSGNGRGHASNGEPLIFVRL